MNTTEFLAEVTAYYTLRCEIFRLDPSEANAAELQAAAAQLEARKALLG